MPSTTTGSNFLKLLKSIEDAMTGNQWDLFSHRLMLYLTARRDAKMIESSRQAQTYRQSAIDNDLLECFESDKVY